MERAAIGLKPKVVLAGIGTKGDLYPLLGLGHELRRRGYECDLLSNRGYEGLAESRGLGFRAVTVPQTNNLVDGRENLDGHVFPSYQPTFDYFAEQLRLGRRLAVINLDECSATNMICERFGLPLCRVTLAPSAFRSVCRPPYPLNQKLQGAFANTYRLYRLPQIYARMDAAPFVLGRVNPYRERLCLPPLVRFSDINAPVQQRLGFFPAWFGTPQPDWPENLRLVGFPLEAPRTDLPVELAEFIQREGRPLVFTPGTGVVDVDRFFAEARACCERLGLPGVFLSPYYRGGADAAARIFHAAFVELAPLLRHSALLVHHGGIGTTARALEAGIPQIIRAAAYDQPDNGDRVRALGVGTFFGPGAGDIDGLVRDARELLASAGVRQRLSALRSDILRTNALAAAADAFEQALERGITSPAQQPSRRCG